MEKKIQTYIEDHQTEILEDLLELVNVQAATAEIERLAEVRKILKALIYKRLHIEAEEIEVLSTRNVLYVKPFEGEHPIVLMGHYDTVHPAGKLCVHRLVLCVLCLVVSNSL